MKKVRILNPMSFVYLFFATAIVVFATVVTAPEEVQTTLLFKLSIIIPVLSSVVLFILEGFYYPRIVNKKHIGIFTKKFVGSVGDEKLINKINIVNNVINRLLWLPFLFVLLATAENKQSLLWLLASFAWLIIVPYSFKMVRNNLRRMRDREAQRTSAQYLFGLGINRQGVENCIESIFHKEQWVVRRRWNLVASFFPLTIAVIWIYVSALMQPVTNQLLVMEHDRVIVARIFIALSAYMLVIIIGYIWYSAMNKRLKELWEQKKSFLRILNVVGE